MSLYSSTFILKMLCLKICYKVHADACSEDQCSSFSQILRPCPKSIDLYSGITPKLAIVSIRKPIGLVECQALGKALDTKSMKSIYAIALKSEGLKLHTCRSHWSRHLEYRLLQFLKTPSLREARD